MEDSPGSHSNHRRSLRLHGYDYTQAGAYYVTIVASGRANIFGTLVENSVQLSEAGDIAIQEWVRLPRRFPAVELDEFILMPNHLHGIIVLSDSCRGTGMAETTQIERNAPRVPASEQFAAPVKGSIPTIVRSYKSSVTQRCQWISRIAHGTIWQRNYYEHIIRSEDELNRIRRYILENPINWSTDRENPEGISG